MDEDCSCSKFAVQPQQLFTHHVGSATESENVWRPQPRSVDIGARKTPKVAANPKPRKATIHPAKMAAVSWLFLSRSDLVTPTSITNGGAGSTWHLPDFSYTSAALRLSKWQPAKMSERLDFVLVQRAGQVHTKLLTDVGTDAGMDCSLTIQKTLMIFRRKYPFVPNARVDI